MAISEISPQKLQDALEGEPKNLLLLDCREQQEFDICSIEGAVLVPMSELADRVGELEAFRETEIVVYCHHGVRSQRVANWLQQQGFQNVKSLAGGIDRWALEVQPSLDRY